MQKRNIFYAAGIILFLLFVYSVFLSAPGNFPAPSTVKVERGSSVKSISLKLKNEEIIRSRAAFEFFVMLFGGGRGVIEADYYFERKLSVWEVARRISKGERHMAPIVATIPEGFTVREMAEVFAEKLPNFNKSNFLSQAQSFEGYLFPDTYFFFSTDDDKVVFTAMRENFEKKISLVRPNILASRKTETDIIKMASLIEGEAKGEGDRELISGILWRRISIGMPLQVDVSPETYKTKGLPKSPIGSPGMAAITAAIFPKSSTYLYYLHDKKGVIHYARTYGEHLRNISKYLK